MVIPTPQSNGLAEFSHVNIPSLELSAKTPVLQSTFVILAAVAVHDIHLGQLAS